jgi:hypothetical protein
MGVTYEMTDRYGIPYGFTLFIWLKVDDNSKVIDNIKVKLK